MFVTLQFLVILMMVADVLTNAKDTTCTMQSVKQGDKTSLTCDFGEDLALLRYGIYIQRYVGNSSEPEHVMDCYWPEASDNYKCTTSSAFAFSGNVSDSLTLDLPSAQSSDDGTYYCEVVEEHFSYQFCNFTTLSANGSRADAQIDVSSDTTTAANFYGSIDTNTTTGTLRNDQSESKGIDLGVVVGVSVAAVVVLVAVICFILFRRRKTFFVNDDQNHIRYTPANDCEENHKGENDTSGLSTQDLDSKHVNGNASK